MSNSSATAGNVVVIDSGLSSAWNTGRLVYQYDFYGNDNDVMVANANTHGALVTAEILENAPDVGIIALKVMPDDGSGASEANIEKALQWVVANADAYDITAVNLSLGGGAQTVAATTSISDELAALAAKRVLTVAAAGNSGDGGATEGVSGYSADVNQICVSASTGDGAFPSWAQRSPTLTDICADGTDVRITDLAGVTYTANGSSFAAPAVTAAVAQAQQAWMEQTGSRLTQTEFLDLARSTGKALDNSGYVELNTDALLGKIAESAPVATAQTGGTTITVNASGSAAGGGNAHFTLLVDGETVGQATVNPAAKDYSFTTDLTADQAHRVQIQYDNDTVVNGQDRNLFVNEVTINGHAVTPTAANVTYDKGALDGKDVAKGQADLWWSGTLVVDADKSWFPSSGTAEVASALSADGQDTVWQHLVAQGLEAAAPDYGDHAPLLPDPASSADFHAPAAALPEHHPDLLDVA